MIFRRPISSYSITLKRAHSLLNLPNNSKTSITTGETTHKNVPSRDQIKEAFRTAAKRHHPDLQTQKTHTASNTIFRECHEAKELLLDYYIHKKYIHPEIILSTKEKPTADTQDEGTWLSVWSSMTSNRSFQIEAFLRLSICLGLAVGTYYHDLYTPERRAMQRRRRDAQYAQFGPQPRY